MMEGPDWRKPADEPRVEETLARAPSRPPESDGGAREETGFERTMQRPGSERGRRLESAQSEAPPPVIPDVRIDALLGRGGQGVVYRGRQTYLERDVAVKVLLAGADEDFEQRFRREARILAGLSDPHIVACYQAGVTEDGCCYLVMEFIDGPDLARWIEAHGKLAVRDALVVVRDVARALEHAHSLGILHRDVKPQNVLLAPSSADGARFAYRAKLADLGLARGGAGELALTQLTAPGAIMGTPSTMAPEQFDDAGAVDFRADIYGLGCVLYHALVGQCAYSGQTLGQVIRRKSSGAPPDPARVDASIPAGVARLVQRMLAADREQRPASYGELIAELETQLAALDAAPLARPSLSRAPAMKRMWIAVGALALALAVWLAWPPGSRTAPAPVREDHAAANEVERGAEAVESKVEAPAVPPLVATEDPRPSLPAGTLWRPFEAWSTLDELLAVDGWRRTAPDGRPVWGCVEGELDALLANSPSGAATASRELMRGAWRLRGELGVRRAFGFEGQEARAGVRIVLDGERAFEWECSTAQAPAVLRWRSVRRAGEGWRIEPGAAVDSRALTSSTAHFECAFDGRELALSLVDGGELDALGVAPGVARELELYVEGGMGQWSAFEFLIR